MLVKVTFVQVRVLLLLGSENYSGKKIPWAVMPVWVRLSLGVLNIINTNLSYYGRERNYCRI